MKWNTLFHEQNKNDKNLYHEWKNNPTKDGQYLCTCIIHTYEQDFKCLRVLAYENKNGWHDIGSPRHISYTILAWTEDIVPCDIDYDYIIGGIITEKK